MTRISDLTALAAGQVSASDLLALTDVSDPSEAASGTTKRSTVGAVAQFARGGGFPDFYAFDDNTINWRMPVPIFGSYTSGALSANSFCTVPFLAGSNYTITDIAIAVTVTGTATEARVWLYKLPDFTSDATLVGDSGVIGVGTTGQKTVTGLSWAVTTRSQYTLGVVANGTIQLGYWPTLDFFKADGALEIFNRHYRALSISTTYGAAPSTLNVNTGSGSPGTSSSMPSWVAMKVSGVS